MSKIYFKAAGRTECLQAICDGGHHHQEKLGAAGKAFDCKLLQAAAGSGACPLENVRNHEGGLHIC